MDNQDCIRREQYYSAIASAIYSSNPTVQSALDALVLAVHLAGEQIDFHGSGENFVEETHGDYARRFWLRRVLRHHEAINNFLAIVGIIESDPRRTSDETLREIFHLRDEIKNLEREYDKTIKSDRYV